MKTNQSRISVIIPAYNEEGNLARTIENILSISAYSIEIIVVDDGSEDDTYLEATNLGVPTIRHCDNLGKGAALKSGLALAEGDIIVVQDADLTFPPEAIIRLVRTVKTSCSDIVYGSRFLGNPEEGSISILHTFGNQVITWLVNVMSGQQLTDVMSGQKAFQRKVFNRIEIETTSWPDIELAMKTRKMGFLTEEIPINYQRRKHGKSKMKTFRDGFWSVYQILRWYIKLNFLQ